MALQLLNLPREVRDMISEIVIINDKPFHLHSSKYGKGNHKVTLRTTNISTSGSGLSSTCKQLNLEYSCLIQKAVFTPGSKTIALVYDFDFSELIGYIKTLRTHEITVANLNENLVVNLFMFASTISVQAAEKLLKWIHCCEAIGIEFSYVVQWTTIDTKQFKVMESAIGGTVEGKKILAAVESKNVKAWSWEEYQAGLKKEARRRTDA